MKRRKLKPPDPKPIEGKHILAVKKTTLKNIVNSDEVNKRIQDAVERCHTILVHTTHFLKAYLLHLYESGQLMPDLDVDFIAVCMREVSNLPPIENRRGRPPNANTRALMATLNAFYTHHYMPLLGEDPTSKQAAIYKLSDLLQYEEKDILKNIKNNIFMHYIDYAQELVNKTFDLKARLKAVDAQEDLSEEEKKLTKRNLSIEIRKVKTDLLSPLNTPYTSDEKYHKWLTEHKPKIIFKTKFMKDNLQYDLKAKPLTYLYGMIHICSELQTYQSFHHAIPLRTSMSPCYITIDTTTLITLMIDDDSITYRKKVKQVKDEMWNRFFKMDNKAFKRKDYRFHSMIKTDGVGCSILFHRKDQNPDDLDDGDSIESVKELYVDEVTEFVEGTNVVGIDVGMDDLLHCTDGEQFYRYTANQRRKQTKKKKYSKIIDELKKESHVNGKTVKAWETTLSVHNKYTCSLEAFKGYIAERITCWENIQSFYLDPLVRKLKWNGYINRQRSEDKMINQIKSKFGEPSNTIIAIGDWDQGNVHMKGKEPTKGLGMRKTLRRAGYMVYLVDEHCSSCKCHNCHCKNEKFLYRESKKPKTLGQIQLVHGLLSCQTVNGCGSLWNRDVNGCLNIRMLALAALRGEERPEAFRRAIHTG